MPPIASEAEAAPDDRPLATSNDPDAADDDGLLATGLNTTDVQMNPLSERNGAAARGQGASSHESWKKTAKHFSVFLQKYCEDHPSEGMRIFGTANSEDWDFDLTKFDETMLASLTVPVADYYAFYLANEAQSMHSGDFISYESASRYFSAFKCGVNNRLLYYRGKKPLSDEAAMKKVRNGMTSMIAKRCIMNQQPLSKSHTSASFEDIKIVNILCIWKNDALSANLIFFLMALYYFSGRAYEIARLPFSRTKMEQPEEFRAVDSTSTDKICETTIWRTKTNHETVNAVFNHRENFLLDYYFVWAFSMVMCRTPSPSMFYKFMRRQVGTNPLSPEPDDEDDDNDNLPNEGDDPAAAGPPLGAGASRSALERARDTLVKMVDKEGNKITSFFNKCMTALYAAASDLDDLLDPEAYQDPGSLMGSETNGKVKFNKMISSHSAKRFAVNFIAGIPAIKTTWAVIAHGWQLKALSTIFDYLDFKKESTNQVAKAKAGWKIPNPWPGDSLGGGRPPSLHALKCNDHGQFGFDFVCQFSSALFEKYSGIEGANDEDLQELLTATVLMHLPKFVQLLREHPKQQFGNTDIDCFTQHYFLQQIKCAFELICKANQIERPQRADIVTRLYEWSEAVSLDFVERNYIFVSEHQLSRLPENPPNADGTAVPDGTVVPDLRAIRGIRSIAGFLNGFGRSLANANTTLHHILSRLGHIFQSNQDLRRQYDCLNAKVDGLEKNLHLVLQILEHQGGPNGLRLPANMRGQTAAAAAAAAAAASTRTIPSPDNYSTPGQVAVLPKQTLGVSPGAILSSLKDWKVKGVFVSWHTERMYCTKEDDGRKNRNTAKFCVEYLTLFLDEQIPNLPDGVLFGTPRARPTKLILETMAETAWEKYREFYAQHKGPKDSIAVSESLSSFKKFMESLDHTNWPMGPTGDSPYQHPDAETNTQSTQRMKNRAMLVENQVNNRAAAERKAQKKRAREQEQEANKRARASPTVVDVL